MDFEEQQNSRRAPGSRAVANTGTAIVHFGRFLGRQPTVADLSSQQIDWLAPWLLRKGKRPGTANRICRDLAELLIRCSELFHGEWIDHLSPAAALLLSGPDTPPAAVDRAKLLWRKSGMMSYADARQLIDETNRPRANATPPAEPQDPATPDPATEALAAQLCDPRQRRLIRRLRPG